MVSSTTGTKYGVFSAVAALAAAPLLAVSPAASAAPKAAPETLLNCRMSGNAAFSPALPLKASGERTRVNVSGAATSCKSTQGLGVTKATFSGGMTGQMSCTSPPRDVTGDVEITWTFADGSTQKSTTNFALSFRGDLSNPTKPITGTLTGENTGGAFQGNRNVGRGEIDTASAARGCLTGGLDSVSFDGRYEMTR